MIDLEKAIADVREKYSMLKGLSPKDELLGYITLTNEREARFNNNLLLRFGRGYLLPKEITKDGVALLPGRNIGELLSFVFTSYQTALDERIDKTILRKWHVKV